MQADKTGGPAFPQTDITESGHPFSTGGMSLRDYFAAQALTCYLSCQPAQTDLAKALEGKYALSEEQRAMTHRVLARRAYLLADAMLAERAKGTP